MSDLRTAALEAWTDALIGADDWEYDRPYTIELLTVALAHQPALAASKPVPGHTARCEQNGGGDPLCIACTGPVPGGETPEP